MHDESVARIDVAERLDAALDGDLPARGFDSTDPVALFVSLGAEIRAAMQQAWLAPLERSRIHARAVDIAEGHGHPGLRRAWPQLTHLGRPAVVGGAAAAMLAVAGLVALRERRGHTQSVLHAA
ncbi:MAG TPA: hypothetical protein VGQ42_05955 [Candidatus Dormibacteraeota bacterium]|jgi:hypothetical protein|nr:hypothetical protein [Candidatus Dormibacteraeota bacterium]